MKIPYFIVAVLLVPLLFGASCAKWSPEDGVYQDSKHADKLKKAAESQTIGGIKLSVDADIWLDRMPKMGNEPVSLNGLITLRAKNGMQILESTSIRHVFVVKNDLIWVSSPTITPNELPDTHTAKINNGPEWTQDTSVDVICEIDEHGRSHWLRHKGVKIRVVY